VLAVRGVGADVEHDVGVAAGGDERLGDARGERLGGLDPCGVSLGLALPPLLAAHAEEGLGAIAGEVGEYRVGEVRVREPDGRALGEHAPEDVGVALGGAQGDETAERGAADAALGRVGIGAEGALDARDDLAHEPVDIRVALALNAHCVGREILDGAVAPGVGDRGDDDGLDASLGDEGRRGLIGRPFGGRGRAVVEDVLAVLHVEDGVAAVGVGGVVVAGREPDEHVAHRAGRGPCPSDHLDAPHDPGDVGRCSLGRAASGAGVGPGNGALVGEALDLELDDDRLSGADQLGGHGRERAVGDVREVDGDLDRLPGAAGELELEPRRADGAWQQDLPSQVGASGEPHRFVAWAPGRVVRRKKDGRSARGQAGLVPHDEEDAAVVRFRRHGLRWRAREYGQAE